MTMVVTAYTKTVNESRDAQEDDPLHSACWKEDCSEVQAELTHAVAPHAAQVQDSLKVVELRAAAVPVLVAIVVHHAPKVRYADALAPVAVLVAAVD